jgi:hypothetical protein
MPAATVPKNAIAQGAGYLYWATLGSGLPANTVAGSVFTDAWPGAYFLLGVTKEGSEFGYDINVDQIEAAEYLDPLIYVTTGRVASIKFELMQVHATNMKRVINGGSLTTSGAGATLLSTYTPPAPGAEVRCMIGWEAQDNTERLVFEQAFQVGSLAVARKKGADNATLPVEFRGEVAASGFPFQYFTAGTLRG